MLTKLPVDILINIAQYLEIKEKNRMMETCVYLRDLFLYDSIYWKYLDFRPFHSISDGALLLFIIRRLLPKGSYTGDRATCPIKSVVLLDLSGCQKLSSMFICWMLRLLPALRVLRLNQFSSPEVIDNRVTGSFDGFTLEWPNNYDIGKSQAPTHLKVCDSTVDTAAKFILLQKEIAKSNNRFYNVQAREPIYLQHYQRLGLHFSFEELEGILEDMNQLTTLCLHHKNIDVHSNISFFYRLKSLTDLDLSFSYIETRVLTLVIKAVILQLKTLKLMNIKITVSQLNLIKEKGANVECLHLYCKHDMISTIGETVGQLEKLSDFKLYSRTSCIFDNIILNLKPQVIKKLDLSAYKRTACNISHSKITSTSPEFRGGHDQYQIPHYSLISNNAIRKLSCCTLLTELRLGCIRLGEESSSLYESLCSLEVLELRYCKSDIQQDFSTYSFSKYSSSNTLLIGIAKLTKLKELHLYSIPLPAYSIDHINNLNSLEYLTVYDCGVFIVSSTTVEYWLTYMDKLNILVLSQLSVPTSLWLTYIDLVFPQNKKDYKNVIFKRIPHTKTWLII